MPPAPAAIIRKLSKNERLQEFLSTCLSTGLSHRLTKFTEWDKIDRSVKCEKDRKVEDENGKKVWQRRGERTDAAQAGQGFLGDVNPSDIYYIRDALWAKYNKAFFDKDRIWSYAGLTPGDSKGADKLTLTIEAANKHFGNRAQMKYTMRDAITYGQGWSALSWGTLEDTHYGIDADGDKLSYLRKTLSGCKVRHVSPYRMVIDPFVSPTEVDRMRFIGSWQPISKYELMEQFDLPNDMEDELEDFNWMFQDLADRSDMVDVLRLGNLDNTVTILLDLYALVIPKQLGLGPGTRPQVWHFVLAGYDVILQAEPANLPCGRYPYYSCVPEGDSYDIDPTSRISLIKDLADVNAWFFNNYLYARRKSLDGDLVVDPSMVRMDDIKARNKNRGANIYRLTIAAQGLEGATKMAIHRIDTAPQIANFVAESQFVEQKARMISGATDTVLGGPDSPQSRRTAEEIASQKESSSDRVTNTCGIIHDTYMMRLGYAVAKYTQDLLDHDVFVRVTEDAYTHTAIPFEDILVSFDVAVGDNFMQQDQQAKANSYNVAIQTIFQTPGMLGAVNLFSFLVEYFKTIGLSDFERHLNHGGIAALQLQGMQQMMAQAPQMAGMLAQGSMNPLAAEPGNAGMMAAYPQRLPMPAPIPVRAMPALPAA